MKTDKIKSSFTPSNLNKKTAAGLEKLDRKFVQTSNKAKKDLITKELKIDYFGNPDVRQIKISEIFSPPGFTRHNQSNQFEDLDVLDNPEPVKVVLAESIKGFFVIDGQRRLEFQKGSEKKQIKALIVGQVVCRSQIAMARALEMTRFKKPPNTPELVQGLLSLHEIIINDFGEEAFFTHGGNRKSGEKDKQSLSQYIASVLELKQSTVNALLNFGIHVGPYGLAGLHSHEDMQKLSIRTINQINARLKKENLQKQITEMLQSMIETGASDRDLIDTAGNQASNTIRIQTNILNKSEKSGDAGDEVDEGDEPLPLDPSDYDLPPKNSKDAGVSEAKENPDKDLGDDKSQNNDEDKPLNPDQVKKDTLKLIKRLKAILGQFEKLLHDSNLKERIAEKYLQEDSEKFNNEAKILIVFLKEKITDMKVDI